MKTPTAMALAAAFGALTGFAVSEGRGDGATEAKAGSEAWRGATAAPAMEPSAAGWKQGPEETEIVSRSTRF